MTTDSAFEEEVRDLPCDAKLAFVVLEQRGPFTQDELSDETYLTEDETVWALAVLEKHDLVTKHKPPSEDEVIYQVKG
ncbi:MAG: hypothetical protein SV377_02980 [Halobacteria archaeon]|nr:hypothetical protein [Halobacteria archaeon]